MTDLDRRRDVALAVAAEAGALALEYQRDPASLVIDAKGPQDWVTIADREVERLVRRRLTEAFPGDAVMGEEDGGQIADQLWVVDPIDGTTNFLRGLPEYAVSIAYVERGVVELGVIFAPALGHTWVAQRDRGATCDGRAIHVRDGARIEEAVITVGFDFKQGVAPFLGCLERILSSGAAFRRFGAATIGLVSVASGHVDAFWQMRLNPWDVLAGLLIVQEAGGRTNDFLADGGLEHGNPTLACAPGVADAIADIVGIELV
ncbi:MAG: inositol monophosphatase [Deltaproteobacteria bacterium]